jgi:hypothetical protein
MAIALAVLLSCAAVPSFAAPKGENPKPRKTRPSLTQIIRGLIGVFDANDWPVPPRP